MTEISKDRKAFLKKWAKLREIMAGFEWEKDGLNSFQRYKYITEAQYKRNFEKALQEVGLLWKMETLETVNHGLIGDKMHLIEAKFRGQLIDPDTGEFEEFLFNGTGADNGDKALYKAVTGGHKFFLASNFNVAEGNDPENDEEVEVSKHPASPEKREEIKEELTRLKDELGVSVSSFLTELIVQFKEKREREKWVQASILMEQEYKTNKELSAWVNFEEDMLET